MERSLQKKARQTGCDNMILLYDAVKSAGLLAAASALGFIFQRLGFIESNIITVYVLAVLIISIITSNRIYSFISSAASVLIFNFLFTDPHFTLWSYEQGYPFTFAVMFIAALITGSLATRLKEHAKQSAQSEFRAKVLFETNQMLQKAAEPEDIVGAAAGQIRKLLKRELIFYPEKQSGIAGAIAFYKESKEADADTADIDDPVNIAAAKTEDPVNINTVKIDDLVNINAVNIDSIDHEAIGWALQNNKRCGAYTNTFSDIKWLYLPVSVNNNIYGVMGILMGGQPLEDDENSMLSAILGECALALENNKNAREKEEAAVKAEHEQLRANLLRAISHDLRTPLTSISGNASNLLYNEGSLDADTRRQLYEDIYDDSQWLINLVENLLSVTRIEEGRLNLHLTGELMEDVIEEALKHIDRHSDEHKITVNNKEDILFARMDARLIIQVIINIVDNAVKYTDNGSEIEISTYRDGENAVVSISDNGKGIPDDEKTKIFDMFYSGANSIADSRRSLGLGLSLCRSIIHAHGGEIYVSDNTPHGTIFTFTLPAEEVQLHE